MESDKEKVDSEVVKEVQTHSDVKDYDVKCDTKGHQKNTQRSHYQTDVAVSACCSSSLKTPPKSCNKINKNNFTPIKFSNYLNINPSQRQNSSMTEPKREKNPIDIFQALEITYYSLRSILAERYIEFKLGEFGEYERFKDLEAQRKKLSEEIKISSRISRGTWNNQELPEFLFEGLSLRIQLSAVLEKLVSMLERRVKDDDAYLRRHLSFGEYGRFKEAEKVRKNARFSSSFILKRRYGVVDETCSGWDVNVKKGKFEMMPLNDGNGFNNNDISICNEAEVEEAYTPPPKRRLTFEE